MELARNRDPARARALAARLLDDADGRLALHVTDEAESIAPRLLRLCDPDLSDAIEQMMRGHAHLAILLAQLRTAWSAILAEPTSERCAASALAAIELCELVDRHLYVEETRIFPALAQLTPADRDDLAAEIRDRRLLAAS